MHEHRHKTLDEPHVDGTEHSHIMQPTLGPHGHESRYQQSTSILFLEIWLFVICGECYNFRLFEVFDVILIHLSSLIFFFFLKHRWGFKTKMRVDTLPYLYFLNSYIPTIFFFFFNLRVGTGHELDPSLFLRIRGIIKQIIYLAWSLKNKGVSLELTEELI